jgi:hypothetical protein
MSVPWFSPDSFMVNKNNKHELIPWYREWNLQLRVNQLRNSLFSWSVKCQQNVHKGHPLDPILSPIRSAIHVYVSYSHRSRSKVKWILTYKAISKRG